MEQEEILSKLTIISEAEVGHKLCVKTGKWYTGSGIFNSLYRTVSGESRKDILDIMDSIVEYITNNQDMDIITRNTFMVSIPSAILGCEKILETYKDDDNYVKEIGLRIESLNKFKDERQVVRSNQPSMQQGLHGNKAILNTVNMVLANNKAGTKRMDDLLSH
jgi:hypothetical protein